MFAEKSIDANKQNGYDFCRDKIKYTSLYQQNLKFWWQIVRHKAFSVVYKHDGNFGNR